MLLSKGASVKVFSNSCKTRPVVFFLMTVAALVLILPHPSDSCAIRDRCPSCCSSCQGLCISHSCVNTCQRYCCTLKNDCCTSCLKCPFCPGKKAAPIDVVTDSPARPALHPSLTANVNSVNTINNKNNIKVEVNVDSLIVNNINNEEGSSESAVPVRVLPKTQASRRCCTIFVPCVRYNCNPYHYRCHGCQSDYGYLPIDPCYYGGCHKRTVWSRYRCTMGQCFRRNVDCSNCHRNFYQTYAKYSRCYGCFYKDW
jgi:hypothetical protein